MLKKYVFVASTGGHLAQLVRLSDRFGAAEDSLWITFDTPQSRSLLANKRVFFMPYIAPRDVRGVLKARRKAKRLLAHESFHHVVSTGAALALAVLPLTQRKGIKTTYIESVSRVEGPSLTGRLLRRLGVKDLRTQHEAWADEVWKPYPSVLGTFERVQRKGATSPKIFVTLGTIKGFRFDRLVDAVLESGLANSDTVWQLGFTDRNDLPGRVAVELATDDFVQCASAADVVITHAGVGTVLQLLELGISPVVVARSVASGEHVDDHQHQICRVLKHQKLASVLSPEEITREKLVEASSWATR